MDLSRENIITLFGSIVGFYILCIPGDPHGILVLHAPTSMISIGRVAYPYSGGWNVDHVFNFTLPHSSMKSPYRPCRLSPVPVHKILRNRLAS